MNSAVQYYVIVANQGNRTASGLARRTYSDAARSTRRSAGT